MPGDGTALPSGGQTYKDAGVDIDAATRIKQRIGAAASATHGPQVLGGVGGFGAMYELSGYRDPVLVSSTDGVGTKLKVAAAIGRFDTLGEDVVNACVNDVITTGARPLFFLDYIGQGELDSDAIDQIVQGMVRACEASECALIGGETAELPGLYKDNDFDLVGFAVGAVERSEMFDPDRVYAGDLLVGIPSNGLHTNGFSLVRMVLNLDEDTRVLDEYHDELDTTLGEALAKPHPAYYSTVRPVLGRIKGMAHITGGGLIDNVPRALPDGLGARMDTQAWPLPPIFTVLQERSDVDRDEMYRVFNMGLGMVLVCDPSEAEEVASAIPGANVVGEVGPATGERRILL